MLAPAPSLSLVLFLGLLAACGKGPVEDLPEGGAATTGVPPTPPADDDSACMPGILGLGTAHTVPLWRPPEGCTRVNSVGTTVTFRTEEELRAAYTCPDGVRFGVDFHRDQLVLIDGMLSPAQVGTDAYDDGTKVTLVGRQRTNCPDDPRPMPSPFTLGLLLPSGAERTYTEASCTVRRICG